MSGDVSANGICFLVMSWIDRPLRRSLRICLGLNKNVTTTPQGIFVMRSCDTDGKSVPTGFRLHTLLIFRNGGPSFRSADRRGTTGSPTYPRRRETTDVVFGVGTTTKTAPSVEEKEVPLGA